MAAELIGGLRRQQPRAFVAERVLNPASMPHVSSELVAALTAPEAARMAAHVKLVAFADQLIEEVEAADTIVIASPMYQLVNELRPASDGGLSPWARGLC